MKRTLPTLSLAVVIAGTALLSQAPAHPAPSAAATPKPSSVPANVGQAVSKDVCASTKSKWAHLQCEQYNSSAPGDEYFGRMKMSYLGIDNTYKDGAISAGDYTTDPRLISKLDFATDALRRWASKYPHDPQLARAYFLGVMVLRKVYTQPEQDTAWQFIQTLVSQYSGTYFGRVMKNSLAKGFTEHLMATAQVCPTPLPIGVGVMPEVTPDVTPTPSPAPGHPAIVVITPPCVPTKAASL
ncbi:MAG: hypothetical protein JO350_11195 [Candidatus Eremiobacteraeota bacterium]|nr:hypothetical protein [Candidatus Eremiobacteraeota bacterium]